jgi:predicted TIM-barrel fold metal-dependent hydrolase
METAPTTRTYRLINADGHVNEPPDLWTTRVSKKYLDRAPRMQSFDEGDAWILDGVADPINFGMNACAGMDPEDMKAWMPWSKLRPGGYNPAIRLQEQDRDNVDAEVLYPTPRLSQGLTSNQDAGLQVELVRAYNDWLSEYCSHAPGRLGGAALLPSCGIDAAVDEFERAIQLPGIVCPVINCYPSGTLEIEPADDALWRSIASSGSSLSIHASLSNQVPTVHASKLPGDVRFYDTPQRILQFMWSGVLDRFPSLQVVFVEVDFGWVPYFREQVQDRYERMSRAMKYSLGRQPREYFDLNFSYTYITDSYGVQNRHAVGVDRIMWSSDYPHVGADWPHSARTIEANFSAVPHEERRKILADNALRLYGFDKR